MTFVFSFSLVANLFALTKIQPTLLVLRSKILFMTTLPVLVRLQETKIRRILLTFLRKKVLEVLLKWKVPCMTMAKLLRERL